MLYVSILAVLGYAVAVGRCIWFCATARDVRVDDRVEVIHTMVGCTIMAIGYVALWVLEPWRLNNTSLASAIVGGQALFFASYVYHRVDSIIRGRNRRLGDRRRDVRVLPGLR